MDPIESRIIDAWGVARLDDILPGLMPGTLSKHMRQELIRLASLKETVSLVDLQRHLRDTVEERQRTRHQGGARQQCLAVSDVQKVFQRHSPSKSTTADKTANGVADKTTDNTTTHTSTENSNMHTPQPVGDNVILVGSQTSTRPAGVVSTPRERGGSEPPPKRLRREDSASPVLLATPLFRKPRATRPSNVVPPLASPSSHASEFTPDIGAASDLVQEVDNLRVQRMTYVAENRRIHQRIIHKHSEEKALIETRIEQDRQLKAEISSQGERVGELEKERHTLGLLLRNYWKLLSDLDKVSNTHSAFLAQQDSPNVPSPLAVADQSVRETAADTLDTTRRDIREHIKSLEKEQTERHGNFSEAEKVLKRLRDQSAALATQIQHSTANLAQLESSKKQLEEEMQRFA